MGIQLTTGHVTAIFTSCQANDATFDDDVITIDGVTTSVYFDKSQLYYWMPEIFSLNDQLPPQFSVANDDTWHFADLIHTTDGRQWTEDFEIAEMLLTLCMALELISYSQSCELWLASIRQTA